MPIPAWTPTTAKTRRATTGWEYEDYLTYYMKTHTDTSTISINDLLKRTNCDGDSFLSANIMDYMISLGYKISANQKRRIRHVLYNSPLIPGPKVTSTSSRATGSGRQIGFAYQIREMT
jgi:hypothetical protein